LFKKVENGGVAKKRTIPQRRVHCVQYQYFLHFTYLGVCTHPPAYGPGLYGWFMFRVELLKQSPMVEMKRRKSVHFDPGYYHF